MYLSASDADIRVAIDTSCRLAQVVAHCSMVHTTATAIDVANIDRIARTGIGRNVTIGVWYAQAHFTTINVDMRITLDMAVLTATEHRTANMSRTAYGHIARVDVSESGELRTCLTQATAKHITIAVDIREIHIGRTH